MDRKLLVNNVVAFQRDWNREATVPGFLQGFIDHGAAGWFFRIATEKAKAKK